MSSNDQNFLDWVHDRPHRFPIVAGVAAMVFPFSFACVLVAFGWHQNGTLLIGLTTFVSALIAGPAAYANYQRARFIEQQSKALNVAATTDPLTGSLNRRSFYAAVNAEQARAAEHQETNYLILFDLDHFKSINDTYGHQVGDAVLKAVAETTRNHIRSASDCLARWGGEEFAIFMNGVDAHIAMTFAERLRQAFETLELPDCPPSLQVTASFGLSPITANRDIDDALRAADRALYSAKRLGRNQTIASNGPDTIVAA